MTPTQSKTQEVFIVMNIQEGHKRLRLSVTIDISLQLRDTKKSHSLN